MVAADPTLYRGTKTKCEVCRRTIAVSCVEAHMRMHEEENRIKCEYCCATFVTRSIRNRHQRTVHDELELEYECSKCGAKFSCKTYHENHEAEFCKCSQNE